MRLIDSRIGKEHFTCCTPVLVEIDIELRSRLKAYFLIYSLLGVSAKTCTAIAGGFDDDDEVQWYMYAPIIFVWHLAKLSATVSIYLKCLLPPLPGAVRTPSRYKVDSSLPKAIRASHIVVSACVTFLYFIFLVIAFFYLKCHANGFGWWQRKQSLESASMCIIQSSFYEWIDTPCHWTYKRIQIYKTCWFEFWQPSDLTRGLGECPVLSYRTIQEAE